MSQGSVKSSTGRKKVGDYQVSQLSEDSLGSGSLGGVMLATRISNDEGLVAKVIPLVPSYDEAVSIMDPELGIIEKLKATEDLQPNDNILRVQNVTLTKTNFYVMMEKCSTNLGNFLRKTTNGRIDEQQAKEIFKQLLEGYYTLLENDLLHGDLHPQNVLLSRDKWKLADYGLRKILMNKVVYPDPPKPSVFYAPETLRSLEADAQLPEATEKDDMWALGVLLYFSVCGAFPYGVTKAHGKNVLAKIEEAASLDFPQNVQLSATCRALLTILLKKKPVERASFDQVQKHPFWGPSSPTKGAVASVGSSVMGESDIPSNKPSNENTLSDDERPPKKKLNYLQKRFKNTDVGEMIDLENPNAAELFPPPLPPGVEMVINKLQLEQSKYRFPVYTATDHILPKHTLLGLKPEDGLLYYELITGLVIGGLGRAHSLRIRIDEDTKEFTDVDDDWKEFFQMDECNDMTKDIDADIKGYVSLLSHIRKDALSRGHSEESLKGLKFKESEVHTELTNETSFKVYLTKSEIYMKKMLAKFFNSIQTKFQNGELGDDALIPLDALLICFHPRRLKPQDPETFEIDYFEWLEEFEASSKQKVKKRVQKAYDDNDFAPVEDAQERTISS